MLWIVVDTQGSSC